MIKKYFVYENNKNMFFTSYKFYSNEFVILDIFMPIKIYWESNDILKKIRIISNNDNITSAGDIYIKLFKNLALYALYEKDKFWFYEKIKHIEKNFNFYKN